MDNTEILASYLEQKAAEADAEHERTKDRRYYDSRKGGPETAVPDVSYRGSPAWAAAELRVQIRKLRPESKTSNG